MGFNLLIVVSLQECSGSASITEARSLKSFRETFVQSHSYVCSACGFGSPQQPIRFAHKFNINQMQFYYNTIDITLPYWLLIAFNSDRVRIINQKYHFWMIGFAYSFSIAIDKIMKVVCESVVIYLGERSCVIPLCPEVPELSELTIGF